MADKISIVHQKAKDALDAIEYILKHDDVMEHFNRSALHDAATSLDEYCAELVIFEDTEEADSIESPMGDPGPYKYQRETWDNYWLGDKS